MRPQKASKLTAVILSALILSSCGLVSAWTPTAHDWALTEIQDRSLILVVAVGSSNCDRFERVEVAKTDTDVTITAVVSEREAGQGLFGAGCNADLNVETVEAVLERPLGTRSLSGCAPGDLGLVDYFVQIPGATLRRRLRRNRRLAVTRIGDRTTPRSRLHEIGRSAGICNHPTYRRQLAPRARLGVD